MHVRVDRTTHRELIDAQSGVDRAGGAAHKLRLAIQAAVSVVEWWRGQRPLVEVTDSDACVRCLSGPTQVQPAIRTPGTSGADASQIGEQMKQRGEVLVRESRSRAPRSASR